MSSVKFNVREEVYSRLIRCYFSNYKYWKLYINNFDIKTSEINLYQIYCENIIFLDELLEKSTASSSDKLIFRKAVVDDFDSNEKIAKYFNYSESALRNRVNIVLKNLVEIILDVNN